MEKLHELLNFPFTLYMDMVAEHGSVMYIPLSFAIAFGILGQWVLYYKCDLPGVSCLVPVWNIIVFLKIMGRPWWQMIFFIIPPPIIAYILVTGDVSMPANVALVSMLLIFVVFAVTIYVELCNCFGKKSIIDYILVIIFNGFYVMYLGMSSETEYNGPIYGKRRRKKKKVKAA